jgi:RNA polymerase sigma-70 factor (ECF subfamily)
VPPTELEQCFSAARAGSAEALGRLLEPFRHYLLLVANEEVEPALAARLAPSDLVQFTFVKATEQFGQFAGHSQDEFRAWLRQILCHTLVDRRRHEYSLKRGGDREQPLPASEGLDRLASADSSPSSQAIAQEREAALQRALGMLSEAEYEIIQWRNYQELPFAEIGRRLGVSEDAARKRWTRALERLQDLMEPGHEP